MNILLIFVWVYTAMIFMSFWEAYVEGRNAWDKGKLGWKIKIGRYVLSAYHIYICWIMLPLLFTLPLVVHGWDLKLFGILISAYFSGMVLEDFMWYVVNPAVKFKEFFTSFSDYYPWVKIGKRKIIPVGYVLGIVISVLSWYLLWR